MSELILIRVLIASERVPIAIALQSLWRRGRELTAPENIESIRSTTNFRCVASARHVATTNRLIDGFCTNLIVAVYSEKLGINAKKHEKKGHTALVRIFNAGINEACAVAVRDTRLYGDRAIEESSPDECTRCWIVTV